MQRRSLLLLISAVLAVVGVTGVFVYAKSPRSAAAVQTPTAPTSAPVSAAPTTQAATTPPATAGLAIPSGLMAVSVSVSPIASVAGYLEKDSRIAIFDTYPSTGKSAVPSALKDVQNPTDDWATRLVVPQAQVLAVTPKSANGTAQSDSQGPLMITVAVGQADAQRLIHVAQTGRLYFALLTGSSKVTPRSGVDNQGVLGGLFDSNGAGR
ncbi:MAG TPA: RcpC/CpaB family pilus assembly protein [Jatrophihabitantaceae bacterium]|jgi:pilus assembly protein CpaB|nr:RcpC/CpaB family pilus assembly protein [Jatrophihabitantaceae bacterium]